MAIQCVDQSLDARYLKGLLIPVVLLVVVALGSQAVAANAQLVEPGFLSQQAMFQAAVAGAVARA
jgi:hypothetical protein